MLFAMKEAYICFAVACENFCKFLQTANHLHPWIVSGPHKLLVRHQHVPNPR